MSRKMPIKKTFRTSDLQCRPATAEDYKGVMRISKGLYFGLDIVPAMYYDYLVDPLRVMYVAVYHEKVIAFAIARAIDDGLTYEGEAARTDPEYNGLGIFSALRNQLLKYGFIPKFPQVCRSLFASVNVDAVKKNKDMTIIPNAMRIALFSVGYITTHEMEPITASQKLLLRNTAHYLHTATRYDLHRFFTETSFHKKFIPSGILLRDSQVFSIDHLSNIDIILKDRCNKIYISYDDNDELQSISFGTGMETSTSLDIYRYTIDYYGEVNLELMKVHIAKHVQQVPKLCNGKNIKSVTIVFFVLDSKNVTDILEKLRLTDRGPKDLVYQCVYKENISPRELTQMSKM